MALLNFNDTIYRNSDPDTHLNCLCDDCTDVIADRIDNGVTAGDEYADVLADDDYEDSYWSDGDYWYAKTGACHDPECDDCAVFA